TRLRRHPSRYAPSANRTGRSDCRCRTLERRRAEFERSACQSARNAGSSALVEPRGQRRTGLFAPIEIRVANARIRIERFRKQGFLASQAAQIQIEPIDHEIGHEIIAEQPVKGAIGCDLRSQVTYRAGAEQRQLEVWRSREYAETAE